MTRNRLKLFISMLLLSVLIAVVVRYASPYAPVVQPVRDIEEIWAIEDSRTESEAPLITALQNNGVALGYDKYENTFYCALGLENGDEWPEIHLTAPEAKGIEICFVDDYAYDWCAEAIRENYAYELMAYNDEEYSYARIVFTGLPILAMNTDEGVEIPAHSDVPAEITWSYDADSGTISYGRTHKRGAYSLTANTLKNGLKVEFVKKEDGTGKIQLPLEGMGLISDLVLISGVNDPTLIHDRLCWDVYGILRDENEAFGKRALSYVEVFINQEYQGIYLALEPFDYGMELKKESISSVEADDVYRTARILPIYGVDQPLYMDGEEWNYKLYYSTKPEEMSFRNLDDFAWAFSAVVSDMYKIKDASGQIISMFEVEQDEKDRIFTEVLLKRMDLEQFIEYYLFVQGCGLMDNEINNMYVWAHMCGNMYQYRFLPWDMDFSWDFSWEENNTYEDVKWAPTLMLDRAIELDCGGIVRERVLEIWKRLRTTVFTDQAVENLTNRYVNELMESGAFHREVNRWGRSVSEPDGFRVYDCARLRFNMLDRRIEEMTQEAWRGKLLDITPEETIVVGELPN